MECQKKVLKITKLDSNFTPTFVDHHSLPNIKFNGHCLTINDIISISKKIKSVYFLHIRSTIKKYTYFTLSNCLFGSLKLTKKADPDEYKYNGYGIGFDCRSEFSFTDESIGKSGIIFGAYMSSSVHVDYKGKDILILGEGPTRGLNHTLTAEVKYPINFTQSGKRFVLSLHYNGDNSFLFVNATKVYQFKAKDSIRRLCTISR